MNIRRLQLLLAVFSLNVALPMTARADGWLEPNAGNWRTPTPADFIRAQGKEAGDSRTWAGIHCPLDNVAGVALGTLISQAFIHRAPTDGSQ